MQRFLVVDDSEFMRRKLIELLHDLGKEVVGEAANGHEAVKLYRELKPDLVTMDITMPEMCGRDALLQIMEADESASVIMCSTLGADDIIAECICEGAKAYLLKPYDVDEARSVIQEVCKSL